MAIRLDIRDPAEQAAEMLRHMLKAACQIMNDHVDEPLPDDREKLDELVHDVKSREASAINNKGPQDQLQFLLEAGFTADELWHDGLEYERTTPLAPTCVLVSYDPAQHIVQKTVGFARWDDAFDQLRKLADAGFAAGPARNEAEGRINAGRPLSIDGLVYSVKCII